MSQKVDPRKVLELSDGMKRLNRVLENSTLGIYVEISKLVGETKFEYPEPYVQSSASSVDILLREIQRLASSIHERLDKKTTALKETAEMYSDTEEKSKMKQQIVGPISRRKGFGNLFGSVSEDTQKVKINREGKVLGVLGVKAKSAHALSVSSIYLSLSVKPLTGDLTYNPKVKSREVERLQQRLKELGYEVKVDGYFGKETLLAVNGFKDKYGLGNTDKYKGVVGEQTWLFLFGSLRGNLSYNPNEYSNEVRMAQIRLQEIGYDVKANGKFDESTLKAVNAFKESNKLGNTGEWEGLLGPQTWGLLFAGGVAGNSQTSNIDSVETPNVSTTGNSLLISKATIDLIVRYEVTSKKAYEQLYKHPVLPGESSGITIGIGYDLGQVSKAKFKSDWEGKLSTADYELLLQCVGMRLKQGDSANNKKLQDMLQKVSKVSISWDAANFVFSEKTLPQFVSLARNTFPNYDKLPENAKGVLVSLVYNRGGDLSRNKDRRKEMVEIADYMASRTSIKQADLDYIANRIEAMKRLWPNSKGLINRRIDEAALLRNSLQVEGNKSTVTDSKDSTDITSSTGGKGVPLYKQGNIASTYTGNKEADVKFLQKFASEACLVTAIAAVVNSKGLTISPGDFALLCDIDRKSHLLQGLPKGISYAGSPVSYDVEKLKELLKQGETPIIRFGTKKTHFVVATRVDVNGQIYVMDPASGKEVKMSDAHRANLGANQIRIIKVTK